MKKLLPIHRLLFWLAIIAFSITTFGCMTPAEQMNARQMEEYRARTNVFLKSADTQGLVRKLAEMDPEFERIYYARTKDVLDKRDVVYPRVRKNVWPIYSHELRRTWKEAHLYFALIIAPNGEIKSIRYLRIPELDSDDRFISIATEALKNWEFESGSVDGVPDEFTWIIPIRFVLH